MALLKRKGLTKYRNTYNEAYPRVSPLPTADLTIPVVGILKILGVGLFGLETSIFLYPFLKKKKLVSKIFS